MADFNPLNELPDPKSFTGNNMGGTFMLPGFFDATLKREQAAAPFIQMAQEAERMKVDQSRQMNPMLLEEKGLQNTGLRNTNDRFSQSTPHMVRGLELGNIKAGLENDSMGMKNALEGVSLPGQIKAVQEKPLANAIDMFSSSADQIKKLPPPLQVGAYMQAAKGVADSISDPAMKQRFMQEFMSDPTAGFQRLQAQAAQKYNTPAAAQARETATISGEYSNKSAAIHANATIKAAEIREKSAMALQKLAADQPKNAAVMVLNARKWLASPPENATPEQKAQMEGIIEGDIERQALNEYKAYASSTMATMDAAAGKAKTVNDFLNDVRNRKPGQPGPVPRPGPTNDAALQQKVLQSGVQYEPDKYEYRIGPNGEVQRKPKG